MRTRRGEPAAGQLSPERRHGGHHRPQRHRHRQRSDQLRIDARARRRAVPVPGAGPGERRFQDRAVDLRAAARGALGVLGRRPRLDLPSARGLVERRHADHRRGRALDLAGADRPAGGVAPAQPEGADRGRRGGRCAHRSLPFHQDLPRSVRARQHRRHPAPAPLERAAVLGMALGRPLVRRAHGQQRPVRAPQLAAQRGSRSRAQRALLPARPATPRSTGVPDHSGKDRADQPAAGRLDRLRADRAPRPDRAHRKPPGNRYRGLLGGGSSTTCAGTPATARSAAPGCAEP